jgi:Protein of unknown function (DUF3551)
MLRSKGQLIPALMRTFVLAATSITLTVGVMPLAAPIALTVGVVALTAPAEAQSGQWCSRRKGATNCMYQTQRQCRASVSGRGGNCFRRHS